MLSLHVSIYMHPLEPIECKRIYQILKTGVMDGREPTCGYWGAQHS